MQPGSVVRLIVAALAATCAVNAQGAADIDVEFVQDGKTTYCQGVREDEGALVFEQMKVSSAGKCPIVVEMNLSQKTLPTVGSPLAVTWTASLAKIDAATSLFPRVLDTATGKPKNVIASLLLACKSGTNCANQNDVVVPAVTGSVDGNVGAFDADGKKQLRAYQFQFPQEGQYVVVGKVVLPGDAALNISATEFVSFQLVQVGVSTTPGDDPGTVKPADEDVPPVRTSETPTESPNIKVNAETADDADLQGSGNKNLLLLSVIAGVGAIGVVAAFAISRRQSRAHNNTGLGFHDDTMKAGGSIYRLDDAPPKRGPPPMPAPMPRTAAGPVPMLGVAPPPGPRRKYSKQNRYYETGSAQSDAPMHIATTHRAFGHSEEEIKYNESENTSISSDAFVFSMGTSLNSLHDSTVRMPLPNHRVSATTTHYTDSLGGMSEDSERRTFSEINLDDIESQMTIAPTRPTDMTNISEYDGHGLDQSTYSWVYSDSDLSSFRSSTNI